MLSTFNVMFIVHKLQYCFLRNYCNIIHNNPQDIQATYIISLPTSGMVSIST